jgi:hypothetical protein
MYNTEVIHIYSSYFEISFNMMYGTVHVLRLGPSQQDVQ